MRPCLLAVLWFALTTCDPGKKPSNASIPSSKIEPPNVATVKAPRIELSPARSPRGFALPKGCKLRQQHTATLPPGDIRIVTASSQANEVAVAFDPGKGEELQRGLLSRGRVSPVAWPWRSLEHPPLLDRSLRGWIGGSSHATTSGIRELRLWRQWAHPVTVRRGDSLTLADIRCTNNRCTLLTSLAKEAWAPGASLLQGDPESGTSWRATHVEPDDSEPWQPHSILEASTPGSAVLALHTPQKLAIWGVSEKRVQKIREFDTPHGVYGVSPNLAVFPLDDDTHCEPKPFTIGIGSDSPLQRLEIPARPDGVVLKALGRQAWLAWIAPESCLVPQRKVMYAARIDPKGRVTSGPLATTRADGFALYAKDSTLVYWVVREGKLIVVRSTCS